MVENTPLPKILYQARTADDVGLQLRWDPPGVMDFPSLEQALVCIHLGAPAKLACRRDGKHYSGTSVHGDIDIIPAHTAMRWQMFDRNDNTLVLSLPQTLLRAVSDDLDLNQNRVELRNRFQIRDTELAVLGWSVKRELELGCPSGRAYLDGLTLAVASRVVARHSSAEQRANRNAQMESLSGANRGLDGRRLKLILSFIEEQLAEELPLASIAAVAAISVSRLKATFRASTGMPVHQYILQRRVERATELLRRDHLSMADVAAAAGFAHQSHMARHLRRTMGLPPQALRRRLAAAASASAAA
jgi:AraC family transcriptional regulator